MTESLGIAPVLRLIEAAYLRWALSELHPLHPDVPEIVSRLSHLERV